MLAREGKIDEAARHFELAIDDSPNFRDAHFNLGQIELTQGRTRDAIDHLLKAVAKKDEQTPACMLWLARAYQQEGDRPKALQYASQARVDATSFGQTALLAEIKQFEKQLKQVDH